MKTKEGTKAANKKNGKQEKGDPVISPTRLVVPPPKFQITVFTIRGTAPFVQHRMSAKVLAAIKETQEAGEVAKKRSKREPKDFKALYEGAKYEAVEGWNGMPAAAFRNAMISACRVVGFHMTKAKLCVFVKADGFDKYDGTPLVKFTKGKPHYCEHGVRLDNGTFDIRARPMWDKDWEMDVAVEFDTDQFTSKDVANLMMRVGLQVGVGEGRNDSKKSAGMGWGSFELVGDSSLKQGGRISTQHLPQGDEI